MVASVELQNTCYPGNTTAHRAVGIIPARGGSKRVPRKNIHPVSGKPLIGYVIEAARAAGVFERIVVSSDDEEILSVSAEFGAEAYQRPISLADDLTHVGPVIDDAVEALNIQADSICVLYPTALLLNSTDLIRAFSQLMSPDVHSVLAVAEFDSPIQRAYEMSEEGRLRMSLPEYFECRSQDLPKRYRDAGMFSWRKVLDVTSRFNYKAFEENGDRYGTVGLVVPRSRAVDIDTPDDLVLAQALFSFHQSELRRLSEGKPSPQKSEDTTTT